MEERLIGKDLSFLAFDKGFDCIGYSVFEYEAVYNEEDDSYQIEGFDFIIPSKYWYSKLRFCPQSLLQKWFRDNHNLHIEIELASDCELNIYNPYVYEFAIYKDCNYSCDRKFYDTYEDCLEAALTFCFTLI